MVQGPFNTDLIKKNISFSQLAELDILKMADLNEVTKESAYISTGETSTGSRFNIFIENKWVQRSSIEPDFGVLIPLELWIEDANEKRVIKLQDPLIIFGSAKTLHFPGGQTKSVNHMDKFEWQGEYARYVHVNSQHVSGLHLILRSMDQSFQVQDLGSTNGTFLNGQKLNPTEGLLSSQTMILGLGGPLNDATHLSAHLHIRASSFSSVVSNEKTPLRQASALETLPKLEIQISGNGIEHRLPIEKFPFTIGRDLNSDFIVPPEHVMVSRTHLVVESFNSTSQQVRVKDISRHGLTVSSEAFAESPTKEIWLELGQSVSLGRTGSYAGIKIAFLQTHSE
jgi:pSer/pThr/pTyr-binding forkhead associated (FHA) protein